MLKKIRDIRPLIIGVGLAGDRHLQTQLKLGIRTGVYNHNLQKIKHLKKHLNIIVFEDLGKALDWSNLVHVCTPDNHHAKHVALALQKGKAVLCEKAFTTNLKDALYLQDLAHKYNMPLIIAQNYRLTPTFAETKKIISESNLGKITKIETTYLHDSTEYQQRTPSNKNKDFLYIGGSHAVDLACWITNEQVVEVKAKMKKNSPLPNSYDIILKFASGILCFIKLDASSTRPYNGTDLIVEGEKGKLISHNKVDELLFYKKGDKKPQSIKLPNNKTLTTALEIKIVDDYLLGNSTSYWPLPDVDEAVNIIRILDIIKRASLSDKNKFVEI